jgi:PPP family 3-phenylpropionic acid transporter
VTATIRWTLIATTTTWFPFTIAQLLHAGSYATTHLAFVLYVRDQIKPQLQAAAHGLYASLAMGLGTAGLTLIVGMSVGTSYTTAFLAMAAASAGSVVNPLKPWRVAL